MDSFSVQHASSDSRSRRPYNSAVCLGSVPDSFGSDCPAEQAGDADGESEDKAEGVKSYADSARRSYGTSSLLCIILNDKELIDGGTSMLRFFIVCFLNGIL